MKRPIYRGRFAPSPTGEVHLGTARTALLGWLRARREGGAFVMRLEDIDTPRVLEGSAEAMLTDLRWLGLDWDEGPDVGGPYGPYVQSERLPRYRAALARLAAVGVSYPCTCSRREIAEIASAPHGDDGPVYPGTCRTTPSHPGHPASIRLRMPEPPPGFVDALHGPSSPGLGRGDFVLFRKDGMFAYQLACALDDHDMQITEVLRGDDLLSSTPRQIAILSALGVPAPRYAHVPLLLGPDGERLAKRHGARSIAALRAAGHAAEAIVGWLAASAGIVDAPSPRSASSLVTDFDLGRISRLSVEMDPSRLT